MDKKRKKPVYYRLHDKDKQADFLEKSAEWKRTMGRLALEMLNEHQKLSDAPIKDFSAAVIYQEFLITTVQFLNRAQETLDEYVRERLEAAEFLKAHLSRMVNVNKAQEQHQIIARDNNTTQTREKSHKHGKRCKRR